LTISDYYDENGNIQELETLVQIKWNYRDKLRSGVTVKRLLGIDDEEYYVYDAEGNRIRKVEEKYIDLFTTRVTEKIYINNVEIKKIYTKIFMGSTTQELKRTTLHVMDDTRRIATVHNWTQDDNLREINTSGELNTNKIRYQYGNHIDSASLELSSTGAIISYEEYFPYGDTSLIAGTAQKEVKLKEYRYTGKEKDDATGLYYYGARYYASWLGRWMSCDPLFRENPAVYDRPKGSTAEEQQQQHEEYMQKLYSEGLNMYCYVKGNPVTFSDPSGRDPRPAMVLPVDDGGGSGTGGKILDGPYGGSSKVKVDRSFTFEGSKGKVDVPLNGKKKESFPGEISIISGNFSINTEQWVKIADFPNELHYKKNDNKYKVDLSKKYNPSQDWYGPNMFFKVPKDGVKIGNKYHGSSITIILLNEKKEPVAKMILVHFSKINAEIYNAQGTEKEFAPGTYIGNTSNKIGVSSGPHLHIESNLTRKKLYKLLSGKK